jgi:hypothetical protein
MTTTLTPPEAQLVLDLLNLYDAAVDVVIVVSDDLSRPDFSAALDDVETHPTATFDSLAKKCTERVNKPF